MKEVLEKTLAEYQRIYKTLETQTVGVGIQTCILLNMQLGCCEYIRRKFGDKYCDDLKIWSMNKLTMYGRWAEIPLSCKTHLELVMCFNIRINNLKFLLQWI
jgi:hypothetical protein